MGGADPDNEAVKKREDRVDALRIGGMDVGVSSRVLVYQDETGDYVAQALEFDLIGSGDSPNKALKDLEHAVEAQVTFAVQKAQLSMIYFKAPAEYEKRWLEAARKGVQNLADGDVAMGFKAVATFISIPAEVVRRIVHLKRRQFVPQGDALCAKA